MLHKRKVAVDDIKPGMYVVELDRPWDAVPFQAPFLLQGFTVNTPTDLERVSKYCDYVYIDPQLGVAADRYLDHDKSPTAPPPRAKRLPTSIYEDQVPVEEELVHSREIIKDTRTVYDDVLKDLRAGKTIDIGAVKRTVGSLVESVIRNRDAATLLVRLKRKDSYTYSQATTVCVIGLAMGRHIGLPENELNTLGTALLLQDVGKIRLPQTLLMKTDGLSDVEWNQLKMHVDASVAMLSAKSGLHSEALEIIRTHHERHDGSGYPKGLRGSKIPLPASISGIVDTYIAMISARPYRKPKTPFEVLMLLYNERDKLFPAAVVENFIQCVGIFPVGSFVELSSGEIGVVITRNYFAQLKPRVMFILDSKGNRLKKPKTIDLARHNPDHEGRKCKITRVVEPADYNLDPDEFFL